MNVDELKEEKKDKNPEVIKLEKNIQELMEKVANKRKENHNLSRFWEGIGEK